MKTVNVMTHDGVYVVDVPCRDIEIKSCPAEKFVIHKSISKYNDTMHCITHYSTGLKIGSGRRISDAIENTNAQISSKRPKEIKEAFKKAKQKYNSALCTVNGKKIQGITLQEYKGLQ